MTTAAKEKTGSGAKLAPGYQIVILDGSQKAVRNAT